MYATTPLSEFFPATVGERVRAARERAGMSVHETVGDGRVVDATTLAAIEDGSLDRISAADLLWLSWQFECSFASLSGTGARERAVLSHHGPVDQEVVETLDYYLDLAQYLDDMGIPDPRAAGRVQDR